jgi:LmbE family N-acetylglucosaminyl deacetylase
MMSINIPRICVIGAHPDDFEILAGGLMIRCKERGSEVFAIVVTDGSLGGDADIRKEETKAAADSIGVDQLIFLDQKDGKTQHNQDLIHTAEHAIKDIAPDLIITHNPHDTHQDHVNTSRCVLSAARRYPAVLLGETSSTFPPLQRFVSFDITGELQKKLDALGCHRSQLESAGGPLRMDEIISVANYRGRQVGVKYAEAFEVWKLRL